MPTIFVNGRFLSQRVTGVQRYAREVMQRLDGRISVIQPRRAGGGAAAHFWEQVQLPRQARNGVLWSPCNSGPVSLERQTVTVHDCAFADHPEFYSRGYVGWYNWMTPRLLSRCRRVITVSEFSRRRIVEYGQIPPEKVAVIPNGVNPLGEQLTSDRVSAVRERLKLPHRYALCVGSLEPRKNLRRLIDAWAWIAPQDGTKLVLVGATCQIYKNAGLQQMPDSVLPLGYVDDADLPAIYAGALLFAYPSLYEGFGLPVLEAMACGTPVVCSNRTAIPEVVGNAALLVDPEDTDALAHAIARLLDDDVLRAELRLAGMQRAREFSWDRTAEQVWSVLSDVTT
jgi:glycosyltransferase involved in cell wall biosynthesis